jgi:hypothetical protein
LRKSALWMHLNNTWERAGSVVSARKYCGQLCSISLLVKEIKFLNMVGCSFALALCALELLVEIIRGRDSTARGL